MKALSDFLHRIANWKTFLVFLAIYLFFLGYVFKNAETKINELAGKPIGIIDLAIGFNIQKTLNMVAGYGDAARAYYSKTEMTADLAYPVVYTFLFGIILTLLYRNKSFAWINVLPFITMPLDYGENINIIILLNTFPRQSIFVATLCEIFKLLKWISLALIILLILYGLFIKLLNRYKISTWKISSKKSS